MPNEGENFLCTSCGKCCHNLKLPLSVSEALEWARKGGELGIICDLMPWGVEPRSDDKVSQRKRSLSFLAKSGDMNVRVTPILVAHYEGACPHLLDDHKCGQYQTRPLACRIYPAELNPLKQFDPSTKLCPEQAWSLKANIPLISTEVSQAIDVMNQLAIDEVIEKEWLCHRLEIKESALANQGYVFHQPDRISFMLALEELAALKASGVSSPALTNWCVISHRKESSDDLSDVKAWFESVNLDTSMQSRLHSGALYMGFKN
jgi:Fe-S-cluster containining protein